MCLSKQRRQGERANTSESYLFSEFSVHNRHSWTSLDFKVCNTVVAFHIDARAESTGICKGTKVHQFKVTNQFSRLIHNPYTLQRQRGYEWQLCNLEIQGPSASSCKCTGMPLGLGFLRSMCFQGGFCGSWKLTLWSLQSHRFAIPQICSPSKDWSYATGREGSWVSRSLAYAWAWALSPCYLMCQYSRHGVQPASSPRPLPTWVTTAAKVQRAVGELLLLQTLGLKGGEWDAAQRAWRQ